jgi:hypothetical protein
MTPRRLAALLGFAVLGVLAQAQEPSGSLSQLKTRAERTNFAETSRYDDVISFLQTVDAASPIVHTTTFGSTVEGRSLPLAVVGRLADGRPETVRASGKLRVYIQGNITPGK